MDKFESRMDGFESQMDKFSQPDEPNGKSEAFLKKRPEITFADIKLHLENITDRNISILAEESSESYQ